MGHIPVVLEDWKVGRLCFNQPSNLPRPHFFLICVSPDVFIENMSTQQQAAVKKNYTDGSH